MEGIRDLGLIMIAILLPVLLVFGRHWLLLLPLYRRLMRSIDLKILWPQCYKQAPKLEIAKAVFAIHVFQDVAWTRDYDHDALIEYINNMQPEGNTTW